MRRDTGVTALVLVTMVAVLVAMQPFIASRAEGYSELAVLGPNKAIGDYPTTAAKGSAVHLFCYVSNHQGSIGYYQVVVKLGTEATQVGNASGAAAPEVASYSLVLSDNASSVFPVAVNITGAGTNLKLIFELWSYDPSGSGFAYTGVWNQLLLNVTGGP